MYIYIYTFVFVVNYTANILHQVYFCNVGWCFIKHHYTNHVFGTARRLKWFKFSLTWINLNTWLGESWIFFLFNLLCFQGDCLLSDSCHFWDKVTLDLMSGKSSVFSLDFILFIYVFFVFFGGGRALGGFLKIFWNHWCFTLHGHLLYGMLVLIFLGYLKIPMIPMEDFQLHLLANDVFSKPLTVSSVHMFCIQHSVPVQSNLFITLAFFFKIQSSAIITRSSIVRYYINIYSNWGRISIRCWKHKRHPHNLPKRVNIWEKTDRVITAPQCIYQWFSARKT